MCTRASGSGTPKSAAWKCRWTFPLETCRARVLLFLICGSAVIWLAHAARQIQAEADRRRNVVRALQDMMSQAHLDQIPGFDLHGFYSPASSDEEVGGDFYDVYPATLLEYVLLVALVGVLAIVARQLGCWTYRTAICGSHKLCR